MEKDSIQSKGSLNKNPHLYGGFLLSIYEYNLPSSLFLKQDVFSLFSNLSNL